MDIFFRQMETYYELGSRSYFSESAYEIGSAGSRWAGEWQTRYWGDNYARLLSVKRAWDPSGAFWCRHCVGSDLI